VLFAFIFNENVNAMDFFVYRVKMVPINLFPNGEVCKAYTALALESCAPPQSTSAKGSLFAIHYGDFKQT